MLDLIATVVSVYDGDTFTVSIPDCPAVVCEAIPVRVRDVDTPEIRGKCEAEKALAIEARDFTRSHLPGTVTLISVERGKYFRLVADVEINGKLLSDMLIEAGLAKRWTGKKESWC